MGVITMMTETTMNKLIEMRLTSMADALRVQLNDHTFQALSFEERLGLLVDVEYTNRKNNRLARLIKNAKFDNPNAAVADINYSSGRILDQSLINRLARCDYIVNKHNLIIMGATGSGKTYLACALGIQACQKFYTVKYIRLPELLVSLSIAKDEGNYTRVFKQFVKPQLLIIDEWMLVTLTESESKTLLEIIHARHKRTSTIFCSQFVPAGWHAKFGDGTLADAILDRIVHDSYTIEIKSKPGQDHSMREIYGLKI